MKDVNVVLTNLSQRQWEVGTVGKSHSQAKRNENLRTNNIVSLCNVFLQKANLVHL